MYTCWTDKWFNSSLQETVDSDYWRSFLSHTSCGAGHARFRGLSRFFQNKSVTSITIIYFSTLADTWMHLWQLRTLDNILQSDATDKIFCSTDIATMIRSLGKVSWPKGRKNREVFPVTPGCFSPVPLVCPGLKCWRYPRLECRPPGNVAKNLLLSVSSTPIHLSTYSMSHSGIQLLLSISHVPSTRLNPSCNLISLGGPLIENCVNSSFNWKWVPLSLPCPVVFQSFLRVRFPQNTKFQISVVLS